MIINGRYDSFDKQIINFNWAKISRWFCEYYKYDRYSIDPASLFSRNDNAKTKINKICSTLVYSIHEAI